MSERMTEALFDYVHEDVHAALSVSLEMAKDIQEGRDGPPRAVSLEQVCGPLALGMFHDGILFAIAEPGAARAYADMMVRDAGLDEADRAERTERFAALVAAYRRSLT